MVTSSNQPKCVQAQRPVGELMPRGAGMVKVGLYSCARGHYLVRYVLHTSLDHSLSVVVPEVAHPVENDP